MPSAIRTRRRDQAAAFLIRRPKVSGLVLALYFLVGSSESARGATLRLVEATVAAASPFAVEPEMAAWARAAAGGEAAPQRVVRRLAAAVRRQVRESVLETGTARQAFRGRRANCAGFAFLVSALARSLGVEAVVVEVSDLARGERRGTFLVRHRHVAIGLLQGGRLRVIDRQGALSSARHRFRVLEDRTAAAIYYSNRGAELLLAARPREALAHLRHALRLDPAFEPAHRNLEVARRRACTTLGECQDAGAE